MPTKPVLNFKSKTKATKTKGAVKGKKTNTVKEEVSGSELERLRKKFAEFEKNNAYSRSEFIKLETGDNVLRILPITKDTTDFYVSANQHFIQSIQKGFLCLKDIGQDCPFCNAKEALEEAGATETAKLLNSNPRFLMNVIQDGQVGILQIGAGLMRDILNNMLDEKVGIITDLKRGRDICITKSVNKKKTSYKLKVYDRTTVKDYHGKINTNLSAINKYSSEEEMEEELQALLPDLKKKAEFELDKRLGKKDLPF